MAWLYLFIAGLMEIGWPVGFKISQDPAYRWPGIALAVGCLTLSTAFLWLAQRNIPIGTAYAVWTGIGAIGVFVMGIVLFDEPRATLRLASVLLIVTGVIGLRLTEAA